MVINVKTFSLMRVFFSNISGKQQSIKYKEKIENFYLLVDTNLTKNNIKKATARSSFYIY